MAVVFLAFATSQITFIKLFGIGLAMAVLMDATVIRATLVPAFMRLAGEFNWWAPPFLRRVYERYGIHEAEGFESESMLPGPDHVIDVREPAAKKTAKKATAKKKATAAKRKTVANKKSTAKKSTTKRAAAKR